MSPRARALLVTADHAPADAESRAGSEAPDAAPAGGRFRAKIAAKVTESWQTVPHFTVSREVRADALLAQVAELRATIPGLTVTDLLLRALASAAETDEVGLAVASDHGVMIPVVRDVLREDLAGLATDRRAVVERARAGRLAPADQGTPITTLSNLGPMGVDAFTGIVALGQQSLLTVGSALPRVVATDAGPAIQTTFHATFNADHRLLDGADVAAQLGRFASAVEAPASPQRGAA
jgi:pyruvate dehydrogenase E2 component (dihydrolipoamide acetyltransferase)